MLKLLLFFIIPSLAFCESFTPYKHLFRQNILFYETYLGSDSELSDLGRLHLLGLRYLIDMRLEEKISVHNDSNEIYYLTMTSNYLHEEFNRRYE